MGKNYDAFRPEFAESLIQTDNVIEHAEATLENLRQEKEKAAGDPDALKNIEALIRYQEAELRRYRQNREDILRGYE